MTVELPPQTRPPRTIEWMVSVQPVAYPDAIAAMEQHVAGIAAGTAAERVWLLEHPAIYTAGTSATPDGLVDAHRFPVYATGRGGQYTYHGPGQRIAYVMLDLKARGGDVRAFVQDLEGWLIDALADLGVAGFVRSGRIGVWVERSGADGAVREEKIAALGIRVRRGVTYHGVSLNVAPDLSHFSGIVPCGLAGYGVTSLAELGVGTGMAAVDQVLRRRFDDRFGRAIAAPRGAEVTHRF